MTKGEPPSASYSSLFWSARIAAVTGVVQDQKAPRGGLFVNRAQALKFAMFENGHRPQAVIMVPDVLELDLSGKPRDQDRSRAGLRAALARAA